MLMLLRAGVSASTGVRRNLWHGLASHLQRRTLATVEESVAIRWNPKDAQKRSDDAPDKPETAVPLAAECPTPVAEEFEEAVPQHGRTAIAANKLLEFGPFPVYSRPDAVSRFPRLSWRRALRQYIDDPERFESIIYWRNGKVMVVYENFPMASIHLLAVTMRCRVDHLSELTREHLPHLKIMVAVAESIINQLSQDHNMAKSDFQYGFTAITSLLQLPLHIMSRDFATSPFLVRKVHWNTFNTGIFIPARTVISALERDGKLKLLQQVSYKKMLRRHVHCPRCNKLLAHIPKLKRHLSECQVTPPEPDKVE